MKTLFILLALIVSTGSFAGQIADGNEAVGATICSDSENLASTSIVDTEDSEAKGTTRD